MGRWESECESWKEEKNKLLLSYNDREKPENFVVVSICTMEVQKEKIIN